MNVRRRIKALRELAARPGTVAEGQNASRLADELEARYAAECRQSVLEDEDDDDGQLDVDAGSILDGAPAGDKTTLARRPQDSAAFRDDFEFTKNSRYR